MKRSPKVYWSLNVLLYVRTSVAERTSPRGFRQIISAECLMRRAFHSVIITVIDNVLIKLRANEAMSRAMLSCLLIVYHAGCTVYSADA